MRDPRPPSPSVIVGVDGSRSGLNAALWAVDEAVERDIPLRLVYVIEPVDDAGGTDDSARARATAEIDIQRVIIAVEATDKPVKIEVEVLHGQPTEVLLAASHAAAMLCIGAVGLTPSAAARLGSTAAVLAIGAYCPVAIIRRYDPSSVTPGSIVVEVDKSSDGEVVLQRGIDEALLRGALLVVITVWHAHFTDIHDNRAVAEQNRRVRAELNRRLARSTHEHPDLDVSPVAVHGSLLNYLSHHAQSIQLVIVGRRRAHCVAEMIGPPSYAALQESDRSVLVCDPHDAR